MTFPSPGENLAKLFVSVCLVSNAIASNVWMSFSAFSSCKFCATGRIVSGRQTKSLDLLTNHGRWNEPLHQVCESGLVWPCFPGGLEGQPMNHDRFYDLKMLPGRSFWFQWSSGISQRTAEAFSQQIS
jgi:hypothetical protein